MYGFEHTGQQSSSRVTNWHHIEIRQNIVGFLLEAAEVAQQDVSGECQIMATTTGTAVPLHDLDKRS